MYFLFLLCFLSLTSCHVMYSSNDLSCVDYTTNEDCINGNDCAWCEYTQTCGTCNLCTGDLHLIGENCPDTVCDIRVGSCIFDELFSIIIFDFFIVIIIVCAMSLTLGACKGNSISWKILGFICGVYTTIGIIIIVGGIITWAISLFIMDKNYTIFVLIANVMSYYVCSAVLLFFVLVIFYIILTILTIVSIISINVSKRILNWIGACCGNKLSRCIKIGISKYAKFLAECFPCWKTRMQSAVEIYDEL